MNLLISACLMGIKCRYDGGRKPLKCLDELMEQHVLIPVCPEVLGGLPTPRTPSERIGDRVKRGDTLCTLHVGEHSDRIGAYNLLRRAIRISSQPVRKPTLIHAVVEG